jgi:hypothetical protein
VVIYAGWVERGVYSDNAKFKETGRVFQQEDKNRKIAKHQKYFSEGECLTKIIKNIV